MLAKIRRMRMREGMSIREVAKRTGLSRNTVRQWLRREGVTDTYLQARPAPARKLRTVARLARIVRKAEERFASAEGGPVSLADLCVAAGVSQGTLYHAFTVLFGESPLAYFRKRRLTDARSMLLGTVPGRSAIKRAALGVGLTHLGRFSAEYRHLFGESPSATLNRPTR
jgi:AraC-like DNA-binding protein